MSDYISREAVINQMREWQAQLMKTYGPNDEYVRCLDSTIYNVEQIPAADVRPVVKGKWIEKEHTLHDGTLGYSITCSACGEVFTEVDLRCVPKKTNFCPNCGASMYNEEEQT